MNELHEARKQTKALLPFARAVLAQDEALDALADIGKQTAEAERVRAVAVKAKDDAQADLAGVYALRDAAKADFAEASAGISAKIAEGEAIVGRARLDAAALVDEAQRKSEGIRETAKRDGADIIARAQARKAEIERSSDEASAVLADINSQIVEASQRLADTNAEIDRLRNLFAPKG